MAHNRYQQRGGEDESTEMDIALLRSRGHEVRELFADNRTISPRSAPAAARRTVWSGESYRALRRSVGERRPDIVHVQNFFPLLSPAIYYAARAEGVPVVQTLHNYRLLCPSAVFFREGRVCEDCQGRAVAWPGVAHACYRGSRPASAAVAAMLAVHTGLRTWTRRVAVYVALSEFTKRKFVESGLLPADRIVVKPHFVDPDPGVSERPREHALFVGRLSVEKGLFTLLAAWERVPPTMPLKIVGDGPLTERVREAAARVRGVELLGRRPLGEIYDLMGRAAFLVFPSEWYETFGRVGMEAFATGTPVIAARIGAVAELVEHGRTGLHFAAGDPDDLAAQLRWALDHPAAMRGMGREAREEFERKYTAETSYDRTLAVYRRVVEEHRPRRARCGAGGG